jgi:histidinol dehydrogenase
MRVFRGLEEAKKGLLRPTPWLDPPASPSLTAFLQRAFGEDLAPREAVRRIIAEVHERGDDALRDFARRFDNVELSALEVGKEEIARAYDHVDMDVIDALHKAAEEIEAFHKQQARTGWLDFERGVGQMITPIQRVGIYVPGGRAAYPSTVLMTAIPARVAGVPEIVVTTPGRERGQVPAVTLVACSIARVHRVFRVGGPQAIAALALGTESVPHVDKVFGPGNLLVQLAKQAVYGVTGVDALQGPTETMVVADDHSDPVYCAADLLAQAEHDPEARPVLVTTSERLVPRVQRQVERQLRDLPEDSAARVSIEQSGGIVLVKTLDEAVEFCNAFAPEHLCLLVKDPWSLAPRLTTAGGIFVGEHSPEVLGDYIAGPSHVMPTAGAANHSSPVSVFEFLKVTSIIAVSQERMRRLAPSGVAIAKAEGLVAHARALELRLTQEDYEDED